MEPKSVHVTPQSAQAEHKSTQVELQAFPKPPKASQSLPKVSQTLPQSLPQASFWTLGDRFGEPWGPQEYFWAPKDDVMRFYNIL